MTARRMPSFFVVGAQKAGTTSLHRWLAAQPGVVLPEIKETHYLSWDERYAEGLDSYLRWFPRGDANSVVGEVDPDYLFFPAVPDRMRALVAAPRLVFVFREPLARAYSHYRMTRARDLEPLSFADALEAEDGRLRDGGRHGLDHHSYLARGRYAEQVRRFHAALPESECLYLTHDELFDPATAGATFERLCEFLRLPGAVVPPDPARRHNPASVPRSPAVRRLLTGSSPLKRLAGAVIRSERWKLKIAMAVDRANRTAAPPHGSLDRDALPAFARAVAAEEAGRLEELTGLDCSGWRDV